MSCGHHQPTLASLEMEINVPFQPVTCHRLRRTMWDCFPHFVVLVPALLGPGLKVTSILLVFSHPLLWNLCVLRPSSPLMILVPCQASWTHLCRTCCLPLLPRKYPLWDPTALTGGLWERFISPKGSFNPEDWGQRTEKTLSQETCLSIWFCFPNCPVWGR